MEGPALILFAHGARDPAWAEPFRRVLARVQARAPASSAMLAYLELMTPDLATAIDLQVDRGYTDLRIVPLFLGPGGHVRRDLPRIVEQARIRHAGIRIELVPPAGEHDAVIEALADYTLGESSGRR